MKKKLVCCLKGGQISLDFEEQERIVTYNGLESCIFNNNSYDNESGTSRGDGCVTDSFDDDSSISSSNNASGSFSSLWTIMKKDDPLQDEWNITSSPQLLIEKDKQDYTCHFSNVESMKEKFAKLLLGEDITGGAKGISSALSLSNAITNLAASVFGELWKLEPLQEDKKNNWHREMDWLLSPTNYMIELVPAKQSGNNGCILEIMAPKARVDVLVNLPALQKLDSMLIEALDSMINNEFWYSEVGSRAEGRSRGAGQSQRWWLPSPHVPKVGLSDTERKRLLNQGKLVYQVFKATRSINENILDDIPIPDIIKYALPKSGRAGLGEEVFKILNADSSSVDEMMDCLNPKSEHEALDAINRLEAAIHVWKERITEQTSGSESPIRTPRSVGMDPLSEHDKIGLLLNRAEMLMRQLKNRYPNLPQTFLDAKRIQYCKDIGHAIIEAYSRVLANLAFSILSRIGDILQEDVISNPNSPAAISNLVGEKVQGMSDSPMLDRVRHSLIHQLNNTDRKSCYSDVQVRPEEAKMSSIMSTPSRSRVWCIGSQSLSAKNSP